jgi:hypothetical protein
LDWNSGDGAARAIGGRGQVGGRDAVGDEEGSRCLGAFEAKLEGRRLRAVGMTQQYEWTVEFGIRDKDRRHLKEGALVVRGQCGAARREQQRRWKLNDPSAIPEYDLERH